MRVSHLCILTAALLTTACSGPADDTGGTDANAGDPKTAVSEAPTNRAGSASGEGMTSGEDTRPRVVFLGDSLTAGYGLDPEQAYPTLVAAALEEKGKPIVMVNAGISGDTTADGLRRLPWLLRQSPDVLVLALGANDGLRGIDLTSTEDNLRRILETARDAGVKVLLAGMLVPPNMGPDYSEQFAGLFPRLAREFGVPLLPFLLEGVAGDPELNQADGIHPTAEGQQIVAANVLAALEPVLDSHSSGQR